MSRDLRAYTSRSELPACGRANALHLFNVAIGLIARIGFLSADWAAHRWRDGPRRGMSGLRLNSDRRSEGAGLRCNRRWRLRLRLRLRLSPNRREIDRRRVRLTTGRAQHGRRPHGRDGWARCGSGRVRSDRLCSGGSSDMTRARGRLSVDRIRRSRDRHRPTRSDWLRRVVRVRRLRRSLNGDRARVQRRERQPEASDPVVGHAYL